MSRLRSASALGAVWWPVFWISTALLALAVTMINRDFYRYFAARLGLWFALRVIPLHWLYFAYCGFCVLWGTLLHYLEGASSPPSVPSPPLGSDAHVG